MPEITVLHTQYQVVFRQVVVLCGVPLEKQLEINDWTHQNGVHFVAAETRGLFAYVCLSFGDLWLHLTEP